ncbi:hypothetical protein V474_07590 [Novosphingobium barchaimii LL02]|uniref:Uncharacterized protein n=1 Tax=Novosphingobium barchaimii LL02 TaxID=1114963 RepID=A0A0J7Y810_9SPHN|nr:hypothetical protein [Novosphingobium barchaimii]KMS59961.1 hypothetical protein V474_07590 [Novosphingobium barchaimii LL02]
MKWSEGGFMLPTDIFEAATLQYSVMAICDCQHSARFETKTLWWHFKRRRWDDRLGPAKQRFWCRVCRSKLRKKVRPVRLEFVAWAKGDFELAWPDERTWKEAVRRVR